MYPYTSIQTGGIDTAIKEEELLKNYILVALEDTPRKDGDIYILPWKVFITNLWQDAYV